MKVRDCVIACTWVCMYMGVGQKQFSGVHDGCGAEEILWCGVCICMFVVVGMFTTLVTCLCLCVACLHACRRNVGV